MFKLFRKVFNNFNSQSNFTYLKKHRYLKQHLIKIVPTNSFACAAYRRTQHLKKAILITLNKNKIN